jgi:hypothetical protein
MKQFALVILVAGLILGGCKKDDTDDDNPSDTFQPKQEQWGFAVNYTATWCGPCGNWGAPLIQSLSEVNRIVAITNHASGDPMHVATLYTTMTADRTTGGGIPSFWVGDEKVTTSNAVSKANELINKPATTGIILKHKREGANMVIETRTKFFSAAQGDYYLSVYVLESGIPGDAAAGNYKQNGATDPAYKHKFVLRAANTPNNAYGELIVSNPEANKVVDKNFTIAINASWNKEVYACAILWKYDASAAVPKYKFVNAFQVK